MTTEVLSYTISAGTTVRAPRGRLFFVKTAANPLSITASGRPGAPIKFSNITAGLKYGPVDESQHWEYLEITSATTQTVELIIGDDDVEVAGTVSIAGTVATREAPGVPSVAADSALAAGANAAQGANATAKQTCVSVTAASAGPIRLAFNNTATATFGFEIQPGMLYWFDTGQGFSVYNPNSVSVNWFYGYVT